jgi:anti-sigma B factor antagonist
MMAVDDSRTRLVVTPTALGWSVSGEIDASTGHILGESISDLSLADSDRPLAIDVGDVDFIDSSGLQALINLARDAGKVGVGIALQRPSPSVARLLSITGLGDLFGMNVEGDPASPPAFDGVTSAARRSFPSELRAIPTIREFVRRAGPALDERALADLELVASELATNAVRHGAGDQFDVAIEIETASTSPSISVSVRSRLTDADRTTDPHLWRRTKTDGLTGRGLAIVDSVSDNVRFAVVGDTVEVTSRLVLPSRDSNDEHGDVVDIVADRQIVVPIHQVTQQPIGPVATTITDEGQQI